MQVKSVIWIIKQIRLFFLHEMDTDIDIETGMGALMNSTSHKELK